MSYVYALSPEDREAEYARISSRFGLTRAQAVTFATSGRTPAEQDAFIAHTRAEEAQALVSIEAALAAEEDRETLRAAAVERLTKCYTLLVSAQVRVAEIALSVRRFFGI